MTPRARSGSLASVARASVALYRQVELEQLATSLGMPRSGGACSHLPQDASLVLVRHSFGEHCRRWQCVHRQTGIADLPLHLLRMKRSNQKVGEHNLIAFRVMASETLKEGLDVCFRHYAVFENDACSWNIGVRGETARGVLTLPPGVDEGLASCIEYDFANFVETIRTHIQEGFAAELVEFTHAPLDSRARAAYEDFFGCPVRFGRLQAAIHFARSRFEARLLKADAMLASFLDRQIAALVNQVRTPMTAALATAIRAGLVRGDVASAASARWLGMSERTLHRRLHEEGTSYQAALDQVRATMANKLLANTNLSLGAISSQLGFGDVSGFYRAFKRWTGGTPAAARRTLEDARTIRSHSPTHEPR